jgi:hypothetical protein
MGDLARHKEAMVLAFEAHALEQESYRPCTLLGALLMEAGNLTAGHSWYEKADALGAPSEAEGKRGLKTSVTRPERSAAARTASSTA